MTQAHTLPQELHDAPFGTRTAIARGVAPRRLRARDVHHPFHGVNRTSTADTLIERIRAYRARMLPGQVFSHETAAALYGFPLAGGDGAQDVGMAASRVRYGGPHSDGPPGARRTELHVSVAFPRTPPRARGVRGHSVAVVEPCTAHGMPVCSAVQVWQQLGASLSGEELVAMGDHIVGARARDALATVDELRAAAAATRTVGASALRWAAERIRFGADSRPESLLRLTLVEAGLGEPSVNPPVLVGGRLMHPDLVYFGQQVVLEYEGDGHRTDAAQWHADIARHEAMVVDGWRVVRVTRRDLFVDRPAFLQRVGLVLSARAKRAVGPPPTAPFARFEPD